MLARMALQGGEGGAGSLGGGGGGGLSPDSQGYYCRFSEHKMTRVTDPPIGPLNPRRLQCTCGPRKAPEEGQSARGQQ